MLGAAPSSAPGAAPGLAHGGVPSSAQPPLPPPRSAPVALAPDSRKRSYQHAMEDGELPGLPPGALMRLHAVHSLSVD